MNRYYVYYHFKTGESDIPFYVGKGQDDRAFDKWRRSAHWKNVVKKYGYDVRIMYDNLSEEDAFWIEVKMIAMFGRADKGLGPLVNHTDGGEGASGNIQSEELKNQKSRKLMHHDVAPHVREAISMGMKGNTNASGPMKEERKQKISVAQLGPKNHRFGKKHSEQEKFLKSLKSPRQRQYEIENGGVTEVIVGLNRYCKEHGFDIRSVHRACTENRRYKGYRITRL